MAGQRKHHMHTGVPYGGLPAGLRFLREVALAPLTSVVEATTEDRAQRVFVKRLLPRGHADAGARAAFAREVAIGEALARAGARVPPFVRAGTDDHGPYLVTGALAAAPAGPVTAATAKAAFAALTSVHDAADERGGLGVVHHDVHLDNLAFDAEQAWVLDFGLATARADLFPGGPPDAGIFRGTVRYAAPETARGEESTASSDRFSLAVAILHRASGVDPRDGATAPAELLYRAGTEPLDRWLETVRRPESASPELAILSHALAPLLAFDAGDRRVTPAWPA